MFVVFIWTTLSSFTYVYIHACTSKYTIKNCRTYMINLPCLLHGCSITVLHIFICTCTHMHYIMFRAIHTSVISMLFYPSCSGGGDYFDGAWTTSKVMHDCVQVLTAME